jgi:hypothetical protein
MAAVSDTPVIPDSPSPFSARQAFCANAPFYSLRHRRFWAEKKVNPDFGFPLLQGPHFFFAFDFCA